ncbi:MAG: exodeoxyribonuclease VII large subunit, partial [Verrucomicrobiota bacterium]
ADPAVVLGELELKKREIIGRLRRDGWLELNKECRAPLLPMRLGLVTSVGSAAYHDFIQTLATSGYGFQVYLADSMMQGERAEPSILRALDCCARLDVELICIVRGGGSKTDLYSLDNEAMARRVAASFVPVWTGIGHESDTSILDYVAHRSFKTPTAVAEELAARFTQLRRQVDEAAATLSTVWSYRRRLAREELTRARNRFRRSPRRLLELMVVRLREQGQALRLLGQRRLHGGQYEVGRCGEQLRTLALSLVKSWSAQLANNRRQLTTVAHHRLGNNAHNLATLRQRLSQERFLGSVRTGREAVSQRRGHLRRRFLALARAEQSRLSVRREHFRQERALSRLGVARSSLSDKKATLKASDPQTALLRGFALVYDNDDGALVRSIGSVREQGRIHIRLADGMLVSEIIAKEISHE